MSKARGGNGIPAELFQILRDDSTKVLHSIWQQIWKTQQWPQEWKRSVFIPVPKKGNAKECSNHHTTAFISHGSKVMLKFLTAWLQQNVNWEIPDVQAGFRRERETRSNCQPSLDHRESKGIPEKTSAFALLTTLKPLTVCRSVVLVTQSCLVLCHPGDCSPLAASVHGILQARILEWVAFPSLGNFPNSGIKPSSPALQADSLLCELWRSPTCKWLSHVTSLEPLDCSLLGSSSMESSRQEYWEARRNTVPSPRDLPNPWIKPRSPALQVNSLTSEPVCGSQQTVEKFFKRWKYQTTLPSSEKPVSRSRSNS